MERAIVVSSTRQVPREYALRFVENSKGRDGSIGTAATDMQAKLGEIMSTSAMYDQMYDRAKSLLEQHNTCGWDPNAGLFAASKKGCCIRCRHLNDQTGCRVKSLLCKLWLCDVARSRLPVPVVEQLQQIWDEAVECGLLMARASKRESLSKPAVKNNIGTFMTPLGRMQNMPVSRFAR
ncbi:hypothetical protein [Geobacter sp. SVR]|uniref:hypothetical protein n=1 Tax=Geobacter sp. SVR TaxID=2495594 RepID=UPI00143F043F|nr:hypothetical protein [Geobacter sp. SVR]BCS54110.1 hypothetical protein GSVR_24180 [Geobacter sp. SVR]GCF87593.1 hypothetical protein GSbR_41930 [Geobacter sp. SVR]